jgi:subtilase family serine protease
MGCRFSKEAMDRITVAENGGIAMRRFMPSLGLLVLLLVGTSLVNPGGGSLAAAGPEPCADLVITDFTISPSLPVQGENATIEITVKNQGSCPSLSFVVQWKSAQLAPNGPSTYVDGLNAGQSETVVFEYAFPSAGNFTTVANADTENTVDETNESNNLAIKSVSVAESAPDLVVTGFKITPVDPAPGYPLLPVEGLNALIEITILNQGGLPAGPFVVQWKSAQTAPTGPSTQVNGLAPDQSTTVSFEYAFPDAGNYLTVANVDTDRTVAESNETNNLAILPITVQEAEIDLTVTDFTVEPAPGVPASMPPLPVQGRLTRVTIEVRNQGNFPAGDFKIQWKPSPLAQFLSTQVNGLKYGASKTVTFDYTYPDAGTFFTRASVDSTNQVREIDENNNEKTMLITVEPPLPDLEITLFGFDPFSPVQGTQASAIVHVRNRGNTPADDFLVRWKPTLLAPAMATQVNGLGVGESTMVTFDHTYPFPGEFATSVEVDSDDRVAELDEGNNSQARLVTVQRATQDLIITDFQIVADDGESPGCLERLGAEMITIVEPILEQGANNKVCITVQNLGNSALGPFVVEWNPDAFGLITPSPSTLSTQIDSLGAGQETEVIFDFVYTQAGEFRSVAKVDAFDNVNETNETNNLAILNVVVTASGPDLVITDMSIEPEQEGPAITSQTGTEDEEPVLVQGEKAIITIDVLNQGNLPSGPFVLEWNPDAFGLITPSPSTLSTQIDNLDPSASTQVTFEFTYHQHGGFRTVAKADAFDDAAETNEANNLFVLNVVVEPAPIDLRITSFTIDPASPVRGSKATASITVRNFGPYPTESFWVQWKPTGEEAGSGPLAMVDGLQPFGQANDSKTVQLESTFRIAGDYTSWAMVDVFDQIIETNENNNTATQNVTVQPREATLRVHFDSLHVYQAFEDGLDGNAEWWMWFFVLDQDASCSFGDETIDGVECRSKEDDSVEDGDNVTVDRSIEVTLVESTPLLLASTAFEVDDFLGIPTGGKFLGFSLQLWGSADYLGVGSAVSEGQEGPCSNGRCFDLDYTVEVVSAPPPFFSAAGGEPLPAPEYVVLPDGLANLIPAGAQLPDGVRLPGRSRIYLPLTIR